jgi:hypothetical protein
LKLIIENTTQITEVNGVPCRMWQGVTESGIQVQCLITRVAVHNSRDCSQFEAELQETRPPSVETLAFPLRMIL